MGIRVLHWNDVERISKIVCVCVKGHGKALERPPFRAGLISRIMVHYSLMTLEKEMATRSSILVWKIPWTEEPGRLQFMGHKESGMTE